MKISINIDCTPAEARNFFGLPDVSPVNELIVKSMVERTKENMDSLSDPKMFWDRAMAASGGGMDAMQKMFESAMGNMDTDKK
ncbi:MAG: DUF6489 family protein [Pseudomonadota bacterium]